MRLPGFCVMDFDVTDQMTDLNLQLLPFLREEDIAIFSCGHVIPRSNLQCLVLGKGPRNIDLQFKFRDRQNGALVRNVVEHEFIEMFALF